MQFKTYSRLITLSILLSSVLIIIISETFENVLGQGVDNDFTGGMAGGGGGTGDMTGGFESSAQIIAEEISEESETEIKDYPLADLPIEDIKVIFTMLDSGNISKVLLNIPVKDIKEIRNEMLKTDFDNILNKLSQENKNKFEERIDND